MRPGRMTLDELRGLADAGEIDTVLLAMPDMQGRLQGKRCSAEYFLNEVVPHGTEGCNYTLATDVEMGTVPGYAMASWDLGYGDFALRPDLGTLRRIPWHDGTALAMADVHGHDGTPVACAPRQVLHRQLDRLAQRGWRAYAGTELEFIVFSDTFAQGWERGYRDLHPANPYNVDYSLLGTGRVEPLLRRIRMGMSGAGMYVESAKGECNDGQHEIAFRYDDALTTCDNHVLYKLGAKEISDQMGMSMTFMPKFNEREGNSCHIHLSLRSAEGEPVLAGERPGGFSPLMEHFLAGQLACLAELTLMLAPNINSYKRYAAASFAPTTIAWGIDNRTCALRVVGHGLSLRVENRVPGGDVNPYLAIAALIAAGLHGIEHELPLEPPCTGDAYQAPYAKVPATLRDAAALFAESSVAKAALGDEVVGHYLNMARVEIQAFDQAVTDWERYRCFERM